MHVDVFDTKENSRSQSMHYTPVCVCVCVYVSFSIIPNSIKALARLIRLLRKRAARHDALCVFHSAVRRALDSFFFYN
jgi:hypothetical protein